MNKYRSLTLIFLLFLLSFHSFAQEGEVNPLSISAEIRPYQISSGAQAEIKLDLSIAEGFKAYEDKLDIAILEPQGVVAGSVKILGGHTFFDKFSKKERRGITGTGQIIFIAEFPGTITNGEQILKVQVKYQACAATYCLFPKSIDVPVPFHFANEEKASSMGNGKNLLEDTFENAKSRGLGFVIFFVFIAGVLTSLTPCILPMLPITIAILGKGHPARTKRARLGHALIYVLGMAATYSSLGVAAASSGALFGSVLSHPFVQIAFALLFIAMGISTFGFFEIQTPLFIQNKVNRLAKIPGTIGIFIAGVVSGVIAGPCVGPVLVGILSYVAQTQDLFLGFMLLFVYSLGLGQLLIILGVSTHLLDRMPRNSRLMKASKVILGTALIATGLFYLSLVWPKAEVMHTGPVEEVKVVASPKWNNVKTDSVLEKILLEAKGKSEPVIIDFFADWCLACKELELKTFSDARLLEKFENFTMIRFDSTSETTDLSALRKKFGIVGLPTVLFFNAKGEWIKSATLNEFEVADKFIERMKILN